MCSCPLVGGPPRRTLAQVHTSKLTLLGTLLVVGAASTGCAKKPDDAAIQARLPGVWSFHPREQLPREKIQDDTGAYDTPLEQVFEFGQIRGSGGPHGDFAEYRHIPKNKSGAERWAVARRGKWFVVGGTVTLQLPRGDEELTVLAVDPTKLRLGGPLFPCQDGCALRALSELPTEARSAQPW